jgi:archaellum component FlaC
MNELVNNLDITVRLAILIELGHDMDRDTTKLCKDALEEIERLRAEVKKMKYLATL